MKRGAMLCPRCETRFDYDKEIDEVFYDNESGEEMYEYTWFFFRSGTDEKISRCPGCQMSLFVPFFEAVKEEEK